MPTPSPRSILIVKTCEIGDLVMTSPLAQALRTAYPECHLTWLVEDKMAEPILGNPFLDEIIIMERTRMRQLRKDRQWVELREVFGQFRKQLRARKYDYLLDLQGFRRSIPIHLLARARRRVLLPGAAKWSHYGPFLPRLRPLQHATDYHLDAVRAGGLELGPGSPPMCIVYSEADDTVAAGLLAPAEPGRPLVALHAFSPRSAKNWPAERHVQLGQRLIRELGAQIVVVGGPPHAAGCHELAAAIGEGAWSVGGRTNLKQLAALLTHCDCIVTNDSGPMHLAAAVGTPVIGIFGATHPDSAAPRGPQHTAVYDALPCSPCELVRVENPACMAGITVDRVYEAVRQRLTGGLIPVSAVIAGLQANNSSRMREVAPRHSAM